MTNDEIWLYKRSGSGTTVIPNPEGTATDDLEKIQIGEDIFAIPDEVGNKNIVSNSNPASNVGNNDDLYFKTVNISGIYHYIVSTKVTGDNGSVEVTEVNAAGSTVKTTTVYCSDPDVKTFDGHFEVYYYGYLWYINFLDDAITGHASGSSVTWDCNVENTIDLQTPDQSISKEVVNRYIKIDGAWVEYDIEKDELPAVTSSDEGKVLGVNSSGKWAAVNITGGVVSYSTTEVDTGDTWDGKPIYAKMFKGTTGNSADSISVGTINGRVLSMSGWYGASYDNLLKAPIAQGFPSSTGGGESNDPWYLYQQSNGATYIKYNVTGRTYEILLKYTKTA